MRRADSTQRVAAERGPNVAETTRAVIECSGAPRDIGHAQGRACRAVLSQAFGRLGPTQRLWHWLGGAGGTQAAVARDVRRYFPHQAECLEGLARGAGVPFAYLVGTLARSLTGSPELCAAFAGTAGGARLACTLPPGAILRRVSPEAGFRALEVTLPELAAALAGVNEKGLAGAVTRVAMNPVATGCAAPAALLLTDCLLRFEALEGALDWSLGRPAGGAAVV